GFENVAMLDGGNAAWTASMEELITSANNTEAKNFIANDAHSEILATIDDVKSALSNSIITLVDTRDLRQHIGVKKKDYVYDFGHIPGSKLLPYKMLHPAKGVMNFVSKSQIAERLKALNINPDGAIILYCNSAYECSSVWFSLYEIYGNHQVRIYDGSLHQWTKDPNNPMTTILAN
ncbi:MAG: rhodanese-like domain-containing protein, partial [Candidatus Thioglobus sp.]|uniref:sulfurtransferase n=1 Tax=Candidatus Thioglobus sp. TaxID=2026721 RepID=UPI002611074A